jgi:hypothetical protein
MTMIRDLVTWGVTAPPPLKGISSRDLNEGKNGARFGSCTLMARSRDNWSGDSLHVPKWLHLMNDHSI